jgi:predicted dehydrogenase
MSSLNRRDFFNHSAVISAALAGLANVPLLRAEEKVQRRTDPNETLRVAVVGVNGRGMSHVGGFNGVNGCEIVTICDCDEAVIGKAMDAVEKKRGVKPKYEKDFRKVIEDKNIDIISIATPNHWHSLMAIWAMEAGKDVYCEKPVSHNVREGRILSMIAKQTKRICQSGTQSRSNPGMRQSIEWIHSGKIGKVSLAYATCYKRRGSIGKSTGENPIAKSIDYDLWCGPAPKLPLLRKKLHYDWHWTWAYGNGDLGNQGIHEMDKARWGLNKDVLPNSVISLGGRFGYVDDGETANTQLCIFDYGDSHLIFDVRGLESVSPFPGEPAKAKAGGNFVGNIWYGSEGTVVCPSYNSGIVLDKDLKEVKKFSGGGDNAHFENFVRAVRTRKANELNAEITEGHLSSALCHLGNVSYRLGREAAIGDAGSFTKLKEAQEAYTRMIEHLKSNMVEGNTKGLIGATLTLDPKTERFTGGADADTVKKANAMLFREYRKGFEVKELSS